MNSIDAVSSYFLEFKREGRKYFECHYVEGNRILPYPKPLEPSVDVLAIHCLAYLADHLEKTIIPVFHHSNIPCLTEVI
jgi:hypothetical protein